MKKKPFHTAALFASLWLLVLAGCSSDPDTLVRNGYDKSEMDAAIERAISEVDEFIAELKSGDSEGYAVKAPIEGGGQTEHFWLTDVTYKNGEFTGTINNEPGLVTTVKIGDEWTLGKTEISDWMYMRDGKMYGNYTLRPLLATMPEEDAEQFREILATP